MSGHGRGGRGGQGGRGGGGGPGGGGRGGGPGGGRGGGGGPGGGGRGGGPGGGAGQGFRGAPRGRGGPGGPVIFAQGRPAAVPQRLADTSHNELIKSFQSLKIVPERPLRPGYGTLGTPIKLRANFFPVKIPKGPIYDYVIEIEPKSDIARVKKRIFQLLEQSPDGKAILPHIAHDKSQRLVSARKLPQPLVIHVPYYEEDEKGPTSKSKVYTVSIKFERELDTTKLDQYLNGKTDPYSYDPLPLLSALNLALQQHASRYAVRVGKTNPRYFFLDSARKVSLGPGVEAMQGFFLSVRPAYKQLMVNVNVCMTAFFEPGNLAQAMLNFGERTSGGMPTLPHSFASKLKVKTKHLNRSRKIKRIGNNSAQSERFNCEKHGGMISVEQYFMKEYKIKLSHARNLPLVDLAPPSRKDPIWVPAELCEIEPGQSFGKLTDKLTAQMIRFACNPPKFNAEAIVGPGFSSLGLDPLKPPANTFGVEIEKEMAVVPARELPPPRVTYGKGTADVSQGSWNITRVQFHKGANVASWWVVVVIDGVKMTGGPTDQRLRSLVTDFGEKCRTSGMAMPSGLPKLIPVVLPSPARDTAARSGAIDLIRTTFKQNLGTPPRKPTFILVLLERRDNFIYPAIKRIGDVELGLHTIHMLLDKVLDKEPRKQDQYYSNVALKLNTKLGGINHKLDEGAMRWLTKKKTIMIGIDVTHPGPGSKEGTPSIATVVASIDDSFVQFPASIRIQESKKEMLSELTDMLVERFLAYERKNKTLPERVFVFRDGVSEGQFDTVNEKELPQILNAFKKLSTKERKSKYRPQLSIVICGKRHHARFFPTDSQFADRNGNTRPGTVVDAGITEVFGFDFYLQAHAGLQGSVKATHYTVVYDENRFGADEIQQGTHCFSYLYARATKAVSLVPPAYYADLACERGRCYLNDFLVTGDDKSTVSGRSKYDKEEEKKRVFAAAQAAWGQGLHPDMRDSMFYI